MSDNLPALRQADDKSPSRGEVFVISQIGPKSSVERKRANEVYKYIVSPAAKHHDLTPSRVDLDVTPGPITSQIIRSIVNATVVVADVTGSNANVFFELGVAQSFGKRLIILVKDVSALPFDVKNEKVIEIGDAETLGVTEAKEAEEQLIRTMDVVLADKYVPMSVVTEAASARSLADLAPDDPLASEVASLRESLDEVLSVVRGLAANPSQARTNLADLSSLTHFLKKLVESDRLSPHELSDLQTPHTSTEFDNWTDRMAALAEEIEKENQGHAVSAYDEEPF